MNSAALSFEEAGSLLASSAGSSSNSGSGGNTTAQALQWIGGKGASLVRLTHAGFQVPPGFLVTTHALKQHLLPISDSIAYWIGQLPSSSIGSSSSSSSSAPAPPIASASDVQATVQQVAAQIRNLIIETPMPREIETAIVSAWKQCLSKMNGTTPKLLSLSLSSGTDPDVDQQLQNDDDDGESTIPFAVRSSGTAEDLADVSFAGQHDTFLNVKGKTSLLTNIKACWASLFTDRAVLYRAEHGFSNTSVSLCVVVQRMVFPLYSGVMFTAHPITGHRRTVSIDAAFGLGEALVSGRVSADNYEVSYSNEQMPPSIVKRHIAEKKLVIVGLPEGGTRTDDVPPELRQRQVLTDEMVLQLSKIGIQIQTYYNSIPQDIEWAIIQSVNGNTFEIFILQSRPITNLYPLPSPSFCFPEFESNVARQQALRVFICFNHLQVMTAPMKPLGISLLSLAVKWLLGQEAPTHSAGRIFIDISPFLTLPVIGPFVALGPSIGDSLMSKSLLEFRSRPEFENVPRRSLGIFSVVRAGISFGVRYLGKAVWNLAFMSSSTSVVFNKVRRRLDSTVERQKNRAERAPTSAKRVRQAAAILPNTFAKVVPILFPYVMLSFISMKLIPILMRRWTGKSIDVLPLLRGLHSNITTMMDLQLGDLADVARKYPAVVQFLRSGTLAQTIHDVPSMQAAFSSIEGGPEFTKAVDMFLSKWGFRCPGEIDACAPRWKENPLSLLQFIAGNLSSEEIGGHRKHFQQIRQEAEQLIVTMQNEVRQRSCLPLLGSVRSFIIGRLCRVTRSAAGLREHPKFYIVRCLDFARQMITKEAERLVETGLLQKSEDVQYLFFEEIALLLERPDIYSAPVIQQLIEQRKADFERFNKLQPPRVFTSFGERVESSHTNADIPQGALAGVPVSSGVVEGIARVVLDPHTTVLENGEILIAPFTDPGWTPLFINAAGLAMEVGGLMTHGSVVAREYGIPAVVSVPNITKLVKTGQRIRVDGSAGYVQILSESTNELQEEPTDAPTRE